MPRRHVAPGRLRRRLTVAFVLVAGIASGALATGSFLLVRSSRLSDSLTRARHLVDVDLPRASTFRLPAESSGLLASVENTGAHAVLQTDGRFVPSDPRFDPAIPTALRSLVGRGRLAYQRVAESPSRGAPAQPFLLIGGPVGPSRAGLYFVFSEATLRRDLDELRSVLVAGWLVVVLGSAAIGNVLARRTLEPVGRASQAAHDMAEGLLDTRLPEQGHDEFGAWAVAFNRMADALEAKIGALSEAQARERRFTSDVAHELRTPVAALVGEASLLREHLDALPPEARHLGELVVRDIARLRRLVDDLMEISRFDAGRESVVLEPVDVATLIEAVIRTRGWQDAVTISGDRPVVDTDRRRIERIASNLIGNAVEHGEPPVEVDVRHHRERVEVRVADRGPGIGPEHLPHLFDRFYKAEPSRAGRGSGLGLAIAIENARLLGGDIEARSADGLGTTFTVRLPAETPVSEPLPAGERPVSPPSEDRAVGSTEGGRT